MKINSPKQGEIWLVDFEPQVGTEIKKVRPAVVLTSRCLEHTTIRLVAPLRSFQERLSGFPFFLTVAPTKSNGLSKKSFIDCAQIKTFSLHRFIKKIGKLPKVELREAVAAASLSFIVE